MLFMENIIAFVILSVYEYIEIVDRALKTTMQAVVRIRSYFKLSE